MILLILLILIDIIITFLSALIIDAIIDITDSSDII